MINITNKTNCCGCEACANICPKKCITMKQDSEGFLYPVVDNNICIKCGMCTKICPIFNHRTNDYNRKCYACFNNNIEEQLNSSSGGIFILLAKLILNKHGVVYGAAFDKNFNVHHIRISKTEDLKYLQKSKYIQSRMDTVYQEVKEDLKQNILVLFSGTSCQIEALNNFLGKSYDTLYTQDFICHGVPSVKVWEKYLNDFDGVKNIDFRHKNNDWKNYCVKIDSKTNNYCVNHNNDPYMKSFLSNLNIRPSCYDCKFKNNFRTSDITLADFWGIELVNPRMYNNRGTSAVIINSKKGAQLFDSITNQLTFTEVSNDDITKYNPSYLNSVQIPRKRLKFFNNLDKVPFKQLVNYCTKTGFLTKVINRIKRIKLKRT